LDKQAGPVGEGGNQVGADLKGPVELEQRELMLADFKV
jgi:hypothetical protein